jgi:hypothetical protein
MKDTAEIEALITALKARTRGFPKSVITSKKIMYPGKNLPRFAKPLGF